MPSEMGRVSDATKHYGALWEPREVRRTSFNKEMIARAKRAAYERILELLTAEKDALDAKAREAWLAHEAAVKAEQEAQRMAEEARRMADAADAVEKAAAQGAARRAEEAAKQAVIDTARAHAEVRKLVIQSAYPLLRALTGPV